MEKLVFKIVKQIPKGKITTYKLIARAVNSHPRAVGRILSKNKNLIKIPCHRVIKSDGSIGGYAGGVEMKKQLLKEEGIDLKRALQFLWVPKKVLENRK